VRVGYGFDVHRLVAGRPLFLGGVEIPHTLGLQGHSDADVLLHAVCDALLGAAGLGDIGEHFPDTNPAYKGVASLTLLAETGRMVKERGFFVENLDATIIAQKPKIAPYRDRMAENISRALGIEPGRVNVKATTTEGLGIAGREEGMAAACVALIEETKDRPGQ